MATSSAPTLSALRHHTRSSLPPRPSKAVRAMLRRKRPSARRPRRRGLRCVQPAVIVDDVPAWLSDWHAVCIDGACSYPAHCCCAGTGGLLHVASPCWRSRPDRHAVAPSSLQRRLLAFLATSTRIQEGACAWGRDLLQNQQWFLYCNAFDSHHQRVFSHDPRCVALAVRALRPALKAPGTVESESSTSWRSHARLPSLPPPRVQR